MKIKNLIKNSKSFYEFLTFIRKIPSLWEQQQAKNRNRVNWSPNKIVVKGLQDYYEIYSPEPESKYGSTLRTYNIFVDQASEFYMRREIKIFIKYAKKTHSFADIGSAEGFYSALFASIHRSNAEILSVDCGDNVGCNSMHTNLLIEQNTKMFKPKKWEFVKALVTSNALKSDTKASIFKYMDSPGYFDQDYGLPKDCKISTLSEIFKDAEFNPKLIKFDIESYEYDVLLDSLEYLAIYKPTLIIEVHNEQFKRRGLNFKKVLDKLIHLGYKLVDYDSRNYLKVWNSHIVLEFKK